MKSARLVSLDAFRGFTIASMMLVNNPGDWGHIYPPLDHAEWNGWTFTDLIFPFFLFIGGVSMTLSLGRRAEEGADKRKLLTTLAKRAGIIFLIGLTLNFLPAFDVHTVRIPGVLQRIALCTLLSAPIVVYFDWRKQLGCVVGLYALYCWLQLMVPVPDLDGHIASGVLEPGRDFGAWVDRAVFGRHVWSHAKTWDPEGIVSTLPAIGSQILGVLTGRWLATGHDRTKKTMGMIVAGVLAITVAEVLDRVLMPINKNLWTVSYSVMMTGMALLIFSVFFFLIDARESKVAEKAFLPFTIYGMNALFLFALSSLVGKALIFFKVNGVSLKGLLYHPIQSLPIAPVNASLIFALAYDLLMFAVAYGMWKKKWFVKV